MSEKKLLAVRIVLWIGIPVCLVMLFSALVFSIYGLKWLRLINAFNPMQVAFLESFYVVNNSGERVEIMPVGMVTVSGRYGPLPRYKNSFPPAVRIPSLQPITIAPGAKTKITYDYDDMNFRHILIRDKSGTIYILDTDKKGTKRTSYGPQKDVYVIPALEELRSAPDALIQCFYGHSVPYKDGKEYP